MNQKYYILFRQSNEQLNCYIGNKICIPAKDWEVITKDIVHSQKRKIRKWLYREDEYNEYIGWID